MKSFMPLCVDVSSARIVMIGGGCVALQKLKTIIGYTSSVTVCSREILPAIREMPITTIVASYDPAQLTGTRFVYACTDDRELNARICKDGRSLGALVNAADDPDNCDFVSPAIFRHEEMSVAISSNGRSAKRSIAWRDAIRDFVAHSWLTGANSDGRPAC